MKAESFLIMLLLMVSSAVSFTGAGQGTSDNPYIVNDCSQLQEIEDEKDAYYILGGDIDCSGMQFSSVDDFSGTLDGDGHIIRNLEIQESGSQHVGVIGHAVNGAEIKDIGVVDAEISGSTFAGTLVGELSDSNLERAFVVNSTVNGGSGSDEVGSLVGLIRGGNPLAADLYSINSDSHGSSDVGGLVGQINNGEITRSYSVSPAEVTGSENTEGVLLGMLFGGSVTNSYWQIGVQPDQSDGGSGETSRFLKQRSTYTSWDFDSVWQRCPGANSGYPFLRGFDEYACGEPSVGSPAPVDRNLNPDGLELSVYADHGQDRELNVSFIDGSGDLIAEQTGVEPGTYVTVPWSGQPEEANLEWSAEVTDGLNSVSTGPHMFTTYTAMFSWQDNTDLEDGYRLFSNASGSFTEETRTSENTESALLAPENLQQGVYTCFRSAAYNNAGQSDFTQGCVTP